MTITKHLRPRPDAPSHRFAVGQTVRFTKSLGMSSSAAEVYQVTRTLPPKDNSLQYRIRNDDERHERVATEDSLEPHVASPPANTSLIERTFRHGKGTEAQQSRDTEAKAGEGPAEG